MSPAFVVLMAPWRGHHPWGASAPLRLWSASAPVSAGTSRLEVDGTEIDFGTVPFERWVTATFRVRNAGGGERVVGTTRTVRVVLGC